MEGGRGRFDEYGNVIITKLGRQETKWIPWRPSSKDPGVTRKGHEKSLIGKASNLSLYYTGSDRLTGGIVSAGSQQTEAERENFLN